MRLKFDKILADESITIDHEFRLMLKGKEESYYDVETKGRGSDVFARTCGADAGGGAVFELNNYWYVAGIKYDMKLEMEKDEDYCLKTELNEDFVNIGDDSIVWVDLIVY